MSACVSFACFFSEPARADSLRHRFGFEASYGVLADTPDFYVASPDRTRPLDGAQVPGGPASVPMVFASFDWSLVYRDKWVFPMLGLRLGSAAGEVADENTFVDGSPARMLRSTTFLADVSFAGFGMRARSRRWSWGFEIDGGVTVAGMDVDYAYGTGEGNVKARRIQPMARGSLEICRQTEPTSRWCLEGALHLFELGLMNGGALALRWEVGA